MMGKANFSDDFKRDAVHQIVERGYPVAEVSQRLGVDAATLYRSAHFRAESPPCDAYKTHSRKSRLNAPPIPITFHQGNGKSEMSRIVTQSTILKPSGRALGARNTVEECEIRAADAPNARMGRLGEEVFNYHTPDLATMEMLVAIGTDERRRPGLDRWSKAGSAVATPTKERRSQMARPRFRWITSWPWSNCKDGRPSIRPGHDLFQLGCKPDQQRIVGKLGHELYADRHPVIGPVQGQRDCRLTCNVELHGEGNELQGTALACNVLSIDKESELWWRRRQGRSEQ